MHLLYLELEEEFDIIGAGRERLGAPFEQGIAVSDGNNVGSEIPPLVLVSNKDAVETEPLE